MIIDLDRNFLFVHVQKTGGLSLATLLQGPEGRAKRTRLGRLRSKLPMRQDPASLQPPIHASLRWAQRRIAPETFERLHKFGVVRDPYERAISLYEFIRKSPRHHRHRWIQDKGFEEFAEYLEGRSVRRDVTQFAMLSDDRGTLLADRVIHFENLRTEAEALWHDLGMPGAFDLPHRNPTVRSRDNYYVSSDARRCVERVFAKDFKAFGYATKDD